MTARRLALPLAIGLLAAVSLAFQFSPLYDPWGWLVWGREITGLDLDTAGGPSWKPLPVAFTTVFAVAGDAAPGLWLFVARAGWLAAPALAWVLAARLAGPLPRAGRIAAGALAALGVVLLYDSFTSWTRQFTGGLSEPLLVALVLAAVERQLARRPGQALALATAAALVRPEAWPLLLVYAAWLWRERALPRAALAGALAAVPVLWLLPDLLGSGDALTGAERARDVNGSFAGEAIESLGRSFSLVLWGLWAGAAIAVAEAWRRRRDERLVLAGLAAAWIAIVALMAGAGYAGLPRFAAPAAALVCVLGAVGLVELGDRVRRAHLLAGWLRRLGLGVLVRGRPVKRAVVSGVVVGVLGLTLAAQAALRVAEVPGELERAWEFDRKLEDLDALVRASGPEQLSACGSLDTADLFTQTAIAWKLDRPIEEVGVRFESVADPSLILVDREAPPPLVRRAARHGETVGRSGSWTAFAIGCG